MNELGVWIIVGAIFLWMSIPFIAFVRYVRKEEVAEL